MTTRVCKSAIIIYIDEGDETREPKIQGSPQEETLRGHRCRGGGPLGSQLFGHSPIRREAVVDYRDGRRCHVYADAIAPPMTCTPCRLCCPPSDSRMPSPKSKYAPREQRTHGATICSGLAFYSYITGGTNVKYPWLSSEQAWTRDFMKVQSNEC